MKTLSVPYIMSIDGMQKYGLVDINVPCLSSNDVELVSEYHLERDGLKFCRRYVSYNGRLSASLLLNDIASSFDESVGDVSHYVNFDSYLYAFNKFIRKHTEGLEFLPYNDTPEQREQIQKIQHMFLGMCLVDEFVYVPSKGPAYEVIANMEGDCHTISMLKKPSIGRLFRKFNDDNLSGQKYINRINMLNVRFPAHAMDVANYYFKNLKGILEKMDAPCRVVDEQVSDIIIFKPDLLPSFDIYEYVTKRIDQDLLDINLVDTSSEILDLYAQVSSIRQKMKVNMNQGPLTKFQIGTETLLLCQKYRNFMDAYNKEYPESMKYHLGVECLVALADADVKAHIASQVNQAMLMV